MPEASDLIYPDFSKLLVRALDRLHQDGLKPFSTLEGAVVGYIVSKETDALDSLGDRLIHEIDLLRIPKWVAVVTWLNPFGMVSHRPKLILRLTQYLFGETKREEESQLPLGLRQHLGI